MILQQPSEKPLPPKTQQIHNVHRVPPITAMRMVHVQCNDHEAFAGSSQVGDVKPDYSKDPPPYSGPAPSAIVHRPVPPPPTPIQRSAPLSLPPRHALPKPIIRSTNHVFIHRRHEAIHGSYDLDPQLETVALDKTGETAIDRKTLMQKNRQRHRHHQRKAFRKQKNIPVPNAIFGTKDGPIDVDLSLVSPPGDLKVMRTLVQATTKHGDIDIRVREIDPRRRLNLEVATRKGTIVLLLPRSFSGYIKMYNRSGHVTFLPAIHSASHLVAQNDRETQVVVGDARYANPTQGAEWDGDIIHVASRNGNIWLGYINEDTKPASEPSVWQKFTNLITCSKARAIKDVRTAIYGS